MGDAKLGFCWLDSLPEVFFFPKYNLLHKNKVKQMKKQNKDPTNAN